MARAVPDALGLLRFGQEDALYEIMLTYNPVEHVPAFEDGRVHGTFTQAGTFSAEPLDPTGQDTGGLRGLGWI